MQQGDLVEAAKHVNEDILEESTGLVLVFKPSPTGLTIGDCHCKLPSNWSTYI